MSKPVPRSELRGMSKKERREFLREVNRIQREKAARQRRRRRIAGWTALGVGVAAAGVGVGFAVHAEIDRAHLGPANLASDGLLLQGGGDGTSIVATTSEAREIDAEPVASTVDRSTGFLDLALYVDYADPDAATLWATDGATIVSALQAGTLSLELHPIAPGADEYSYAAHAAAAVACVANTEPDAALYLHDALLNAVTSGEQPAISDLRGLAEDAGVTDEDALDCIDDGDERDWVSVATARAAAGTASGQSVDATTLFVAGTPYTDALDDVDAFTAFLSARAAELAPAATEDAGADASAGADDTATDG
ncbi:DsbA family protein [Agromyces seonyuensis]|uniref:Thioredoxin-like fold domain-containing protein n=1 Tax=Agromyces seonyuensis TaxID=2662446 RepID=A0A6I4NYV3_9MICO|nr:hypothetical protein [Agromyces seonyuensis]MWB99523.1 hypothetical protein [Agromyces seonyuensis]